MKTFAVGLNFLLALCVFSSAAFADGETVKIASPDQNVSATLSVGQTLSLDLSFGGQSVLTGAALGLEFQDAPAFGPMEIVSTAEKIIDETWENRFGRNRIMVNRANETTVSLREKAAPNRTFVIVFHACDDGFAFRYVLTGEAEKPFVLADEKTTFSFAGDFDCWATDNKTINSSHENLFDKTKLSAISAEAVIGLPLVVTGDFGYAALCEAAVFDWPACSFAVKNQSAAVRLTPRHDGHGLAIGKYPTETPWRVLLLGKKAIDLVNHSGLILNLNPPCQIADTDWIKPGASSWDWWSLSNTDLSTEKFKTKVDFAAEMGWPYTTLDDPWYGINHLKAQEGDKPDVLTGSEHFDFDEGLRYAKEKGVGVFLWLHKDDLDAAGVEKAFKFYANAGAVGLKIDFFDREDQEIVQWANNTIRIAAQYKLMVNYHGIYQPTGTNRTWPNFVTQEGILGNEYNKWSDKVTPTHATTLPYTRFLLGPGDFTPGGFVSKHPEQFEPQPWDATRSAWQMGTRAFALAQCVLYDSPAMTLCDMPENYRGQAGLEMLKNLPSVWDESLALAGEIGEYFVMARHTGGEAPQPISPKNSDKSTPLPPVAEHSAHAGGVWYLSAITNEKARSVEIKLDFLGDGQWTGTVYADSPESDQVATALNVSEKTFTAGETIKINMVRDGGWNVVLRPTNAQ